MGSTWRGNCIEGLKKMDFINEWLAAIKGFIEDVLLWIWDVITYIPRNIWEGIINAIATVFESIPVPSWLNNVDIFVGITPGMSFFMQGFAIPEGVMILGGAYLLRFTIRRIPIIG